jgi:hypothetical protein
MLTVACDNRRIPVARMKHVRTLACGVRLFEFRELRSRTVPMGRAMQDLARGKMPERWPPRERIEHRHLVAVASEGPEPAVMGEWEQSGSDAGEGWVGVRRGRGRRCGEGEWLRALVVEPSRTRGQQTGVPEVTSTAR